MIASSWILGIVALMVRGQELPPAHSPPSTTSATADVVAFRDGKVLLGQVVDSPDRRGPLLVLVRRGWAEANLADRAGAWEKSESPLIRQAESTRRDRLTAWRRSRPNPTDPDDRLTPWLDSEIARLSANPARDAAVKSPLMLVRLPRNTIKAVDRKSKPIARLLRLAWMIDLANPETTPLAEMTQGLEDRGYSASSTAPVSVDHLLPIPSESDEQWLVRRASTEMMNLSGGRFLLVAGAVIPEPRLGEALQANAAIDAVASTLKNLLGEERTNPLVPKFRELASQGRVGAVVTNLEMAPDLATSTVTTTLWVAPGANRNWVPALVRSSSVRPGDLPVDAGANLAEDPQIKAALSVVGSLGFGDVSPELKQRSLNMGFATQKALGEARAALNSELSALALPLESPRTAPAAPKP